MPQFGHLPYVMGEGNKKLSKRDPQAALNSYRDAGYLPEGLLNYLALLGWSIADDHDIFSLDEMVAAFDVADVNANPARFDPKKCLAINAVHIRQLDAGRLRATARGPDRRGRIRVDPAVVAGRGAACPGTGADAGRRSRAASLPADRRGRLRHRRGGRREGAQGRLARRRHHRHCTALDGLEWTTAAIEAALHSALIDDLGLKPRDAYTPLRVAVTGRTVSPPLFESLELLGSQRVMSRLRSAIAL